jgi:hypothetical protein
LTTIDLLLNYANEKSVAEKQQGKANLGLKGKITTASNN